MAALPASLNITQANEALRLLEAALAQGSGALTVDASVLASFDTSAIAVLLETRRLAQAAGRGFGVTGAPVAMIELAGLYGVAELLGLDAQSARA
jgi:phospholipid transport system transporter-binding protein